MIGGNREISPSSLALGHFLSINLAAGKLLEAKRARRTKMAKNRPYFTFFAFLALFASPASFIITLIL